MVIIKKLFTSSLLLRYCKSCTLTGLSFTLRYETHVASIVERKIAVDNVEINYVQTGTGEHNVLCLPGLLGTIWTDFSPQIVGFNLNKFSIIVWDPPGYGKSKPPKRNFHIDYLERDADLAVKLLQKVEISKCSLLGWSDGGITALFLAAKYPDLVNKLVIWGANAFLTKEDIAAYEKIKDIGNWSLNMRSTMTNIYGEEQFQQLLLEWFKSMVEIQNNRDGNICRELVSEIKAPTMVLHGAKDPLVPPILCNFLHNNIKNSKLHIFPDGKHNIHLRFSEVFNQIVQSFLLEK